MNLLGAESFNDTIEVLLEVINDNADVLFRLADSAAGSAV